MESNTFLNYKWTILFLVMYTLPFGLAKLPLKEDETSKESSEEESSSSLSSSSISLPSCAALQCIVESNRPVCGSDGRTYSNACELKRAQCFGHDVELRHRGKCSGKGERQCWTERDDLLRTPRRMGQVPVVPECTPEGKYKRVQCHRATGYCWCVTADGKAIPDTSTRNKQPDCRKKSKTQANRRSSSSRKRRRACTQADRSSFNANLIKIFSTEYSRFVGAIQGSSADKKVVEWKFSQLDLNNDSRLQRAEYRDLRGLVRKVVKPRRCARSFARICDTNADRLISKDEWATCLGIDLTISFHLFLSLHSDESLEDKGRNNEKARTHIAAESDTTSPWTSKRGSPADLSNFPLAIPSPHLTSGPSRSSDSFQQSHMLFRLPLHHPDRNPQRAHGANCVSERQTALDDLRQGTSNPFVPECTVDGKYQRVQCYKDTGYCWCVKDDSGEPVTGTAMKDVQPNCDKISKGCVNKKKEKFLVDLLDFLNKSMMAQQANSSESPSSEKEEHMTPNEQIVLWEFNSLDKNGNQLLERSEWKSFRKTVSRQEALRKCGKKLPGVCDVNQDKKINLQEWYTCMGIQKAQQKISNPKGRNPLEIYLKDD